MPCDRDGNLLWLADETGAHEILQPGGGFNGRTREPGEPVLCRGWSPCPPPPARAPPPFAFDASARMP